MSIHVSANTLPIMAIRKSRNMTQDLQVIKDCSIVSVYLTLRKGGYNACHDRISYRRGGSNKVEGIHGYGAQGDQAQEADSPQSQRRLSDYHRRFPNLCGYHTNRQTRTGKLNLTRLFVLSVAAPPLLVSQASNDDACQGYLIVHYSTFGTRLSRAIRSGEVVERGYLMQPRKLLEYASLSEATQLIPEPPRLAILYEEPFASYIRERAAKADETPKQYLLHTAWFYENEMRGAA